MAGQVRFGLKAPDGLSQRLGAAFADLRCDDVAEIDEWFVVEEPRGEPALVEIRMAGEQITRRVEFAEAAIMSRLNRMVLDREPTSLHLHAAAVGLHDVGLVLAARSGTGKSTTTASLVLQGWTYISDESVALDPGSTVLQGVPKPISLTPDAIDLLAKVDSHREGVWPEVTDRVATHKVLCAASSLGGAVATKVERGVVGLLDRSVAKAGVATISPMSAAETTVRLLSLTQDFERFGSAGLETLAALCAASQCFHVSLADVATTPKLLRGLVEQHEPPSDTAVEIVGFANTRTAFVQSEAVVLNTITNSAASLPPITAAFWRDEIDGVPNRHGVAAKLAELGILEAGHGDSSGSHS